MMGFGEKHGADKPVERRVFRRADGVEVVDERVNGGHRWEDRISQNFKAIFVTICLVLPVLGAAIAIGAAKATTQADISALKDNKVDRMEFAVRNAEQDRERWTIIQSVDSLRREIASLVPAVRESNARIREIYCEDKPASCR